MSRSTSPVLGRAIANKIGFAATRTRSMTVGHHLPRAREIGTAFAAWRRAQPLSSGSSYFVQPMTSPRNPNPRHE